MAWERNRPTNRFSAALVRAVRERDQDLCQLRYTGCTGQYEQIDHIVNLASTNTARGSSNEQVNDLQCVCRYCHNIKTQQEAKAGRNAWKRKPERHPGLL